MSILSSTDRMVPSQTDRRGRLSGVATRAVQVVLLWSHRRNSRKRLATLDAHLLHDLGIPRTDALVEARKPFWRP